jgi:hypothetical protein
MYWALVLGAQVCSLRARADELIDKGAIITGEYWAVCVRSWATLSSDRGLVDPQSPPSCPGPSMILPDARSLPHGLAQLRRTIQGRPRHDLWTKLRLIRDTTNHYAPVLIAQNSSHRRPWRAPNFLRAVRAATLENRAHLDAVIAHLVLISVASLPIAGSGFATAASYRCFAFSPISTRRRMASDRLGLSVCFAAQASTFFRSSGDSRMAVTGS